MVFHCFLVVMITFMTMIALIGLQKKRYKKINHYYMLLLEMTMVGVFRFIRCDYVLYVFSRNSVQCFMLLGFWGAEKDFYATIKFFLYIHFTGSLIMLWYLVFWLCIFSNNRTWSFSLMDWNSIVLPFDLQFMVIYCILFGICCKSSNVPIPCQLPLAHGQAPTIGSIILQAVY